MATRGWRAFRRRKGKGEVDVPGCSAAGDDEDRLAGSAWSVGRFAANFGRIAEQERRRVGREVSEKLESCGKVLVYIY